MKKTNQNRNSDHSMAHVLYQKLGEQWYAFTEVDGDLFMGKIQESEVPENYQASTDSPSTHAFDRKPLKAA